jgi:acylphosphatase
MRRRIVVHGRVQNVFFRDSLRRLADELQVAGWARNTPDGTVEAVFEGTDAAVARLIDFAHDGPPEAAVARVEVFEEEPEGLAGFSIR